MKYQLTILIFALTTTLAGCASLSSGGRMVREFAGSPGPGCNFLGEVTGSSASAVGVDGPRIAHIDLKNETAKAGGNFVRVLYDNSASKFGSVQGEAYACPGNTQIVVRETTPEDKMVQEMKRRNDLAEQEQRNQAIRKFQQSFEPSTQAQPNKANCTSRPYYDNNGKLLRTETVCQ
jgi:hypothetical protein